MSNNACINEFSFRAQVSEDSVRTETSNEVASVKCEKMKKLIFPPSPIHRVNFDKHLNRMDPSKPMEQMMIMPESQSQVEDFSRDFFPMLAKKYSVPPPIYKHVYVTSPSKHSKKPKKKKSKSKDYSWLDSMNPFGCDTDYDEDYDEED